MQDYKSIFLRSRGYEKGNWIGCEICGTTAVDIHHIMSSYRKSRWCPDDGSEILALCRYHHNLIHSENNKEMRDTLLSIVQTILTIKNGGDARTAIEGLEKNI